MNTDFTIRLSAVFLFAALFTTGETVFTAPFEPGEYRTLYARFEQTRASDLLAEEVVSSGELWIRKPGRLLWHVRSPRERWFLVEGDRLTFRDPESGRIERVSLKKHPGARRIFPIIRRLVDGRTDSLKEHFEIMEKEGSPGTFRLVPRNPKLSRRLRDIRMRRHAKKPCFEWIRIHEANGDSLEILFTDIRVDPPLSEDRFSIPDPGEPSDARHRNSSGTVS
jgi:outer membrane lipoprotein-sorting protein